MKLRKLLSIATASVLSAAFLMVGASCNNNNTSGKDENQTIAVIAKGETHAFWQAVKSGAEAAGKKYGYKITFAGPTAESETYIPEQREKLQSALNNKHVKAVVLATIGQGFADELVTAYDKKIPVVEFDSGLYANRADVTAGKDPTIGKVATDNVAAAALVAENFYKYLKTNNKLTAGKEFKMGVIQHDSSATGIDRAKGFEDKFKALAQADGFTVDIQHQTKTNNDGEYKAAVQSLQASHVDAIFMSNEGVVSEVSAEVADNKAKYENILFCGFDCGTNQYNWIKNDGNKYPVLVGSVAQDSYSIGYKAVEMAAKKLAGETFEKNVGIAGQWYTTANIDDLKSRNIFYLG